MNKVIEKWKAEESPDVALKVHEAQIRQLYSQTWSGLTGIMIIMVSACIILWQVVPQSKLLLWAGLLIVLSIARSFLIVAFQRKAPVGVDIYRWARLHIIGTIASGTMWALPSIFLWPANSPIHQLIWPLCTVGLAASAVAKFCTWKPAYLPYLFLILVPMSFRLFSEGGPTYIVLGLLGLVFIVILVQTGEMMNSSSTSVLSMSIHNEALSSFLSEEKTKEEKLNAQLQQEIVERKNSQEELQQRNQELEQLNAQLNMTKNDLVSTNEYLEHALANIRQLSGMLPICSSCKKIRNDSGYWEQIEAYLRDHSEIEFSHSICPDCMNRLYSNVLPK